MRRMIFALMVCASFNVFAQDRRMEPVPPEFLFSHTLAYGFIFSPSGENLLFRYWSTDGIVVAIYDLEKQDIKHKFKMPKEYSVSDLNWISDSVLGFRDNGKIIRLEVDGSNMEIMINNIFDHGGSRDDKKFKYWEVRHNLPNKKESILIDSYYDGEILSTYDIITGEKQDLLSGTKLDIHRWTIDYLGRPRLGVREKGSKNAYFWVDSSDYSVYPVRLPDGTELVYDELELDKNHYVVLSYNTENNNLYLAENKTTGFYRVVELNPESGKLVEVIHEIEGRDVGWGYNLFSFFMHPKTGKLSGYSYYHKDEKEIYVWKDTELKAIQAELDSKFKERSNDIVECTQDLRYCLFDSANLTDTHKKYIFDSKKKEFIDFYTWAPERSEYILGKTSELVFTHSGVELYGYITPATDLSLKSPPVIIMPCGGVASRIKWGFHPYIHYFTSRGYTVLELNTRGCTGYGVDYFLPKTDSLAITMAEDVIRSAKWLKLQEKYKNSKVFLFSDNAYGSYKSALAISLDKTQFDGAALFSAFTDVNSYYKHIKKAEQYGELWFWNQHFEKGVPHKKTMKELSLFDEIANTQTPVLYTLGKDDDTPLAKLFAKLERSAEKNSNLKVQLLVDTHSSIYKDTAQIYYATSAYRFFGDVLQKTSKN